MEKRIKKLEQRVAALEGLIAKQGQTLNSYSIGGKFVFQECVHDFTEINGSSTYLQCKKCGFIHL